MRTRIKICGLTREADLDAVVQAGADAIGFVFYPGSKRYVSPARAAALRRRVPAFVDVVALTVNASQDEMRAIVDEVGPDLLQFHGDEAPEECRRHGRRYLRAFRVGAPGLDTSDALAAHCAQYHDAAGWLFDSHSAGYGGSGLGFDHALLAGVQASPDRRALVLAGGLTPENVADAVRAVRPWAVDVSSGVEEGPGLKSIERVRKFIDSVNFSAN
ncbi:N-(5'-phosphoribosyl)anthranilate isomerase [Bordetella ansorpii]|uniref:N-(5'-phosphoribosyl)anthranilate isomerase n=1 Tax=Bordetella ansorpii TaxID=288768 RepID=A0A157SNN7_9BORD|nr:phosphoribosylanthranilate isomerase [Bordetella ansorpii]SAI71894.1 N-(5'-phosphoribosyl)anthranilate isomerase [Bordetella ansorpii]